MTYHSGKIDGATVFSVARNPLTGRVEALHQSNPTVHLIYLVLNQLFGSLENSYHHRKNFITDTPAEHRWMVLVALEQASEMQGATVPICLAVGFLTTVARLDSALVKDADTYLVCYIKIKFREWHRMESQNVSVGVFEHIKSRPRVAVRHLRNIGEMLRITPQLNGYSVEHQFVSFD
jgi:hypothetical protein